MNRCNRAEGNGATATRLPVKGESIRWIPSGKVSKVAWVSGNIVYLEDMITYGKGGRYKENNCFIGRFRNHHMAPESPDWDYNENFEIIPRDEQ